MNKLMKYYEAMEVIRKAFDAADCANNEEGRGAARADRKAWKENILHEGRSFIRVYRMYENAMEYGNELIDIDDILWDEDFDELMDEFHRNGITRFTFSSTCSGATETAWKFLKAGWQLCGMTQINARCKIPTTNEYEKVPAYVFSL